MTARATPLLAGGTGLPPLRRDARLLALVGATSLSSLGDVAWYIALAWSAAHVAGPAGVGVIMGVGSVPRALILLLGGAFADRLDARRTMTIANLARIGVLLAAIAVIGARGTTLGTLVAIAVVFGVVDALYDPAASTMPRQLVRSEDLGAVASMFQLGGRIARLAGAPLGGVIVAFGGIRAVMLLDAATFAVIALVLALVIRPRFPLPRSAGKSVLRDLAAGFGYLKRAHAARTLTLSLIGLNIFVGPITAVGVVLRTHQESWGATSLGLFDASIGAAAALGAVIAMRWRPKAPARTGLLILIGQAAACAGVGVVPYAGVLACMLVIGVTAGLASAFLSGAFQRRIDPEFLGRTSSMLLVSDEALMPLAMTAFGLVAAGAGLGVTCLIVGGLFAAQLLWAASRSGIDEGGLSGAPPKPPSCHSNTPHDLGGLSGAPPKPPRRADEGDSREPAGAVGQ